ncbi:MAG: GCN5-related N-acetyltransferase [Candidatus Eremiobacteraeota bacterium]|jgi:RimJ/RimL family protein N-acetyltransferase|nr:GCN5-related N-acetyltransferase [Candidatus Eremiobacteraeota bacterium]
MNARRSSWSIRPKGERDADAVAALLAGVAREGGFIATEWPFDVDERAHAMREALLARRCVGWIALDGREVVGDLTVVDVTQEEPELGMIVAAPYRGRGIGRALLDSAFAWARANAKPALTLRVFPDNEPARALYRNTGFVDVVLQSAAIFRRDGSARDAIVMRRPIAEPVAGR